MWLLECVDVWIKELLRCICMFVVSFLGCLLVCYWYWLFVFFFLRRIWKNLKKIFFIFYCNDNYMLLIVKLNWVMFYIGELIEWVFFGEVYWRGGEYYWIWGLLKIFGKIWDYVYLGICWLCIDWYYWLMCWLSVYRLVGWYLISLLIKYWLIC